jgi:hypothetical protein
MKLILKMTWIGFLLAQRVAHLPGTEGLGNLKVDHRSQGNKDEGI